MITTRIGSKFTKDTGQILAEVLVAIGIIVVVLIGMSNLMTKTTKTVSQNTTKDLAVSLVQSQLNFYKTERDKNVNDFFIKPANGTSNLPNGSCDPWQPATHALLVPIACTVSSTVIPGGANITVTATWTQSEPNDSSVSLTNSLMKF